MLKAHSRRRPPALKRAFLVWAGMTAVYTAGELLVGGVFWLWKFHH